MFKTLFVILFLSQSIFTSAQIPRIQFEVFTGIQHVHHHQCQLEDKKAHRGITMPVGGKFILNFQKGFTLQSGFTLNRMIAKVSKFPSENVSSLELKYRSSDWDNMNRLDFFTSTGIEWVFKQQQFKWPLYLGIQYQFGELMEGIVRIKFPNPIEFSELSGYSFVGFNCEFGIAFNPFGAPRPKFQSSFGNPFILR